MLLREHVRDRARRDEAEPDEHLAERPVRLALLRERHIELVLPQHPLVEHDLPEGTPPRGVGRIHTHPSARAARFHIPPKRYPTGRGGEKDVVDTARLAPCPTCGAVVAPGAKYCAECGARVAPDVVEEAPPELELDGPDDEVPVAEHVAEPQYFGLGPPLFVFTVAVVLFVVAVVLVALGSLVLGLLLLVVSFLLLPAFLAGARRWPDSGLARLSLSTAQRARGEASVAADAISTWSRAGRDVVRLRSEQFRLGRDLDAKLHELGRAVLDDDERVPQLTTEARALDERCRRNEAELEAVLHGAKSRVREERAAVVATEVRRPEEESGALAGEREEHEGEPVDAEHVGLEAEHEHGGERGAEPGGGVEDAPQQRERPADERQQPEQA